MIDVLIIAHYCGDFNQGSNNRFNYIAELLAYHEFKVELVTSDYSHTKKEKRPVVNSMPGYKVTLISEPAYRKNISLRRFYSHYVMSKNLKKYLIKRKKPDVIYCSVPSLDIAFETAKYAKRKNVKFIIDVQDLWPEAFRMVLNIPIITDIIYSYFGIKANYIYRTADEIFAVSQTYVDRALAASKKCSKGHCVYIGIDIKGFDAFVTLGNEILKPPGEIWVAYVGTLGHSYDITCVIDAITILNDKGINNIKFIVMGDGPLKEYFIDYARSKDLYCEFTGWMDYSVMVRLLASCDIAVNPITRGAAQSIINKHADYAAAGLPVLNTQECAEYRKLIEDYQAGYNCESNNPKDLAENILDLCYDDDLRLAIGKNHRRLAEEKFDRANTYVSIVRLLQNNLPMIK